MAEISTEVRNGHIRNSVHLVPGEKISLCRCFKSKEFPICDGFHRTIEGEFGPVIVDCPLADPSSPAAAA